MIHANVETLTNGGHGSGFGSGPTPSLTAPSAAPSSKQNLTVTNENTLPNKILLSKMSKEKDPFECMRFHENCRVSWVFHLSSMN
jgi:hypothetical protein